MRFHPTRGAMTIGLSKGGQPPDEVCEEHDAVLKDMARVIAEFHDDSRRAPLHQTLRGRIVDEVVSTTRGNTLKALPHCSPKLAHTSLLPYGQSLGACTR